MGIKKNCLYGPEVHKSFLCCICPLTATITALTAAFDSIVVQSLSMESYQLSFIFLITNIAFAGLACIISLGIFFYCDQTPHFTRKYRILGIILIVLSLVKLVFIVVHSISGNFSIVLKYKLFKQKSLLFAHFVISIFEIPLILWIALIWILRPKGNKPTKKVKFRNNAMSQRNIHSMQNAYTGPETRVHFSIEMNA